MNKHLFLYGGFPDGTIIDIHIAMADNVVPKKTARKAVRKTAARKAPTQVVRSRASHKSNHTPLFIGVGVFILFLSIAIALGYSDKGEIDVSGSITQQKNSGTDEEKASAKNIPVQQAKSAKPDGGLVPTTDVDTSVTKKEKEKQETASSTASSSASSTEATADLVTETETETETEESSTEELQ